MNAPANKPMHLLLLIAGVAAILVSGFAIDTLAISVEGARDIVAAAEPLVGAAAPAIAAPGARAYACAECGVIVSTRAIEAPDEQTEANAPGRTAAGSRGGIEGKPVRNYEIAIRLRDGSMRVVADANPTRWRRGERVTIIAGVN